MAFSPVPNFRRSSTITAVARVRHRPNQSAASGEGSNAVINRLKFGCALLALVGIVLGSLPHRASAITADVARKCNSLLAKEFPPREPGNPAAGSTKGSSKDQRAYFSKCVANGGKMDEGAAK